MSFSVKDNKNFFRPMRQAIQRYGMIEPGEKIAVGMSGGKDSTLLFYLLDTIKKQNRLGYEFELYPIVLDMGMEMDIQPLHDFCQRLGYELEVVSTNIASVVFDIRQEKNPCSLCANLRRGILYQTASDHGYTKVAIGHHLDDAIETFFMNFLLHGQLSSFEPKTYLSKTNISIIRPFIYVEEKNIVSLVDKEKLPVIFNPCPVDKKTKREEMKQLITHLSQTYPDIRQRFIKGMEQGTLANFWTNHLSED